MRISIPNLEIADNEGFTPEKDIFSRQDFGLRLTNLVENATDELVIALDAEWGQGKSTFIKMWRGYAAHHREKKIRSIYFDAFRNDYQKDPFIALAAEIYGLLKDESEEKKTEFRLKAGNAVKSMVRGAIKIGVRAGTGGLLDGSLLDNVEKDISQLLADQVDAVIADRFKSANTDKLALQSFRDYLESFCKDHGGGQPIAFIIDELDRCRPDFALELIESIKHLFSVPGFIFILVMNRHQMEESVKARYGSGVNANKYLQKFVSVWLALPRKYDIYEDHGVKYANHVVESMLDDGERILNETSIILLHELIQHIRPSFREIERILTYFALIQNMTGASAFKESYQLMVPFVCYVKSSHPCLVEKITCNMITAEDLLKETGLSDIIGKSELYNLQYLTSLIKFDLANDEEKSTMLASQEISTRSFDRIPKDVMKNICSWLLTISRK